MSRVAKPPMSEEMEILGQTSCRKQLNFMKITMNRA
jgi:hypothetical protein